LFVETATAEVDLKHFFCRMVRESRKRGPSGIWRFDDIRSLPGVALLVRSPS
jgi:hypothetical protein